jgi:hypothetical protein
MAAVKPPIIRAHKRSKQLGKYHRRMSAKQDRRYDYMKATDANQDAPPR